MSRPRDSQRLKVYRAETAAFPRHTNVFGTNAATQAWVDDLIAQRWFHARWPGLKGLVVAPGRGATASSWIGRITVGPLARNPAIVLHEVAHEITSRAPDEFSRVAAHGPEFAAMFLFLVRRVMGPEDADRLRAAFVAGRVKHRATVPGLTAVAAKRGER